ncbi:hypothetical protein DM02DRAFT_502542, partial [Periconia macrospinosa]
PVEFKVYFLPDNIPSGSIIHGQKDQGGFFVHPVLVVQYDARKNTAHFYSLTSNLPRGIGDLHLYFKLGTHPNETGEEVLRLGRGSKVMTHRTWVNLEKLYSIEWPYLRPWSRDVYVDLSEREKFWEKISRLEASQNRFLYKPLYRDLSWIAEGTILMLLNRPGSPTFGAPVLFLGKSGTDFLYFRIKEIGKLNHVVGRNIEGTKNHLRLKIGRVGETNPGGAPVMYIDGACQDMR